MTRLGLGDAKSGPSMCVEVWFDCFARLKEGIGRSRPGLRLPVHRRASAHGGDVISTFCDGQSFDGGGASRAPSSARSARTTRSNCPFELRMASLPAGEVGSEPRLDLFRLAARPLKEKAVKVERDEGQHLRATLFHQTAFLLEGLIDFVIDPPALRDAWEQHSSTLSQNRMPRSISS